MEKFSNDDNERKAGEARFALVKFTIFVNEIERNDPIHDLHKEGSYIDPGNTQFEELEKQLSIIKFFYKYLNEESKKMADAYIMRAEIYLSAYRKMPERPQSEEYPDQSHDQILN